MKGLDTPVLLEILHGTQAGRALLKTLRGEELATSEINMFELVHLAAHGPRNARGLRQKALVGLRRRITVIPVTARSVGESARAIASPSADRGYTNLVWSTMADAGCGEWLTTRSEAPPKGSTGMKVRII
jgi:predicted nucleic acid-binding protein